MKKFILTIVFVLATLLSVNAQSIQIMQSYNTNDSKFTKSGYTSTRVLVDYFYTSDNGKWNVYSWNSFDTGINANLLLYAEREIGNTNLYGHLETRFNSYTNGQIMNGSVQAGFSYQIPWENGASISLVPQYCGGYMVGTKGWGNDFMFSINSSYDGKHVYYEGYYDSWYVHGFNCFTEQSVYYKIAERFQVGLCGVLVAGKEYGGEGFCVAQPYVAVRIVL